MLLRFVTQRIVRIRLQECLERVLGFLSLRPVAVGLFHLPEMRHGYLQLRVRCFRKHRKKHAEILIRLNGLGSVGRPALFVIGIRNRQLCFGQILAVRIRIDQRLQIQPAYLVPAVLDVVHRLVVQNLVWLRGIVRAGGFIDLFLFVQDLGIARRGAQQNQSTGH